MRAAFDNVSVAAINGYSSIRNCPRWELTVGRKPGRPLYY